MTSFDYILVGGGTAGCILANRLSACGRHRVLMLEAGGPPSGLWIPIPAGFSKLLVNPRYNWRFQTEPEEATHGRVIAVPRGKGLGGSTLINGMIYVRGQPQDYDGWAADGAIGWSAREVEPYFRKLEHYAEGGPHRGHDGPMHIEQVRSRFPLSDAFLQAALQDGQHLTDDYNGPDQEGFGHYQVTQRRCRRWSVVDGYLAPAQRRPNLQVRTQAHVVRLLLEGRRCVGVVVRQDGRDVTIRAGREVILTAGAVQTPQLLELSGIGAPALLQRLGLPVQHALDSVGEHYLDHFATRMNWRVKNTLTMNELSRGWRLAAEVARYVGRRSGILTLGTGLVHGFIRTLPDLPTPDVQWFFMHASYANAAERVLDREPGMTLGITQLRPQSEGSIHARSADPFAPPVIRPNFLAAEEDRACIVRGMQVARRLVSRPALQRYVAHEMSPGPACVTAADWLDFARRNGQTIYHPAGTCRMGSDAAAVVDPRLKVQGLAGLRVADASVMPRMVSGNTQAAVMMIAEKAADLILADAAQPDPALLAPKGPAARQAQRHDHAIP